MCIGVNRRPPELMLGGVRLLLGTQWQIFCSSHFHTCCMERALTRTGDPDWHAKIMLLLHVFLGVSSLVGHYGCMMLFPALLDTKTLASELLVRNSTVQSTSRTQTRYLGVNFCNIT